MIGVRKTISNLSNLFQENLSESFILAVGAVVSVDTAMSMYEAWLLWDMDLTKDKAIFENKKLEKALAEAYQYETWLKNIPLDEVLSGGNTVSEELALNKAAITEYEKLRNGNQELIKKCAVYVDERRLALNDKKNYWKKVLPFAVGGLAAVLYVGLSCLKLYHAVKIS